MTEPKPKQVIQHVMRWFMGCAWLTLGGVLIIVALMVVGSNLAQNELNQQIASVCQQAPAIPQITAPDDTQTASRLSDADIEALAWYTSEPLNYDIPRNNTQREIIHPAGNYQIIMDRTPSEATRVYICDPAGEGLLAFPADEMLADPLLSADGRYIAFTDPRNNAVLLYDAETLERLTTLNQTGVESVAWHPAQPLLAVGGNHDIYGKNIALWSVDGDNIQMVRRLTIDGYDRKIVRRVGFTPDGRELFADSFDYDERTATTDWWTITPDS